MKSDEQPILITGVNGQVGGACAQLAAARFLPTLAPDRSLLDLSQSQSIMDYFATHKFSAVINCAAYTAVDRAESDIAVAQAVNADAPALIGKLARDRGIPVLHISTDYVFDGKSQEPYSEDAPVNPLSVYGRAKAAGEEGLARSGAQYAIMRTSWVQSVAGANFLNTMLRLGETRDQLSIVDDQWGSPTGADDIAAALLAMLHGLESRSGIWHFTNTGVTSWYGLADYIFTCAQETGVKIPQLTAISTDEYPTAAVRPPYSVLNCQKYIDDFGQIPKPWQTAIDEILNERLKR
ncbi:dTDP-4-dehydrorhamnose reductase [Pseudonocardia sp. TMWB2A]|uniref:dTDP-4-dehydrorhamnose reductase n=1 Tax=Pseudonocardia sp. TMWB2A TaxID=687430 RepID=UPI00307E7585